MNHSTPGLRVHNQFPKFTQIHVHWVSDAIQTSHPLSSPSPPAFNLSQHQRKWKSLSHVRLFMTPWTAVYQAPPPIGFSRQEYWSGVPSPSPASGSVNESALHIRWPKYWSFSFSISPSNEYSGLISFRMGCLDLLAVPRTLKSLIQHHSSKASIIRLSDPYMTTEKTINLTRWNFVGKVMSLLFNMVSRLVITFLPRSKCLLISWLQSPSAVILELPKNSLPLFPHLFPWRNGARCHDLNFLNLEL